MTPRYATLPLAERPRGESLRDVTARLLPYFCDVIVPDLRRHACVLVVSHGNTLRDIGTARSVRDAFDWVSGHRAGLATHLR